MEERQVEPVSPGQYASSSSVRADATLQVGATQQAVEVTAAAMQLQTTDAKSSVTVTNKLVDELPLVVGGTLRIAPLILIGYGGLLYLTYHTMATTPSGFIPAQDKGFLLVNVQLPDAASLDRTNKQIQQLDAIARQIPGVKHTVTVSGQSVLLGANAPNFGTMFITFDDFEVRKHDPKQYGLAILAQFNATARQLQ